MAISSGGNLSRGVGPKGPGEKSNVEKGKTEKLDPVKEFEGKVSPQQFGKMAEFEYTEVAANTLEDIAGEEEPEETENKDSKSAKESRQKQKNAKSNSSRSQSRVAKRRATSRKQVANKETTKTEEKSETHVKSDAKGIKEPKTESKETVKSESSKEAKEAEDPKKQEAAKQSKQSSAKKTIKEQKPQEKAALKTSRKEEAPHTKDTKETVGKEAQKAKSDSKEKANVAPKARSKEAGKEEQRSSVKEEVKSQPKEELKTLNPKEMKQAKKSEKTEQKAPLEKTAKDTSTNKKQTEETKTKSEDPQKANQASKKNLQKQESTKQSKKASDTQLKETSVKSGKKDAPKTLQKEAASKAPPEQAASKGKGAQQTASQTQNQSGAQVQSQNPKLQNTETTAKSKSGSSDGLGLKNSQVVDGSPDKGGDTGDSSDDQNQGKNDDDQSLKSMKKKLADDDRIRKSWSHQEETFSLDDEINETEHAVHKNCFLGITSKMQSKKPLVTASDQGVDIESNDSGGGFTIFSKKYHLGDDDSMEIQIGANIASYKESKATNDWNTKQHLLENLSREYSGFVRDYMSGVRGYQLHICDGSFHFTSDMTPNNPTGQYRSYLKDVQAYEDDYLIAKNNLWSFDPVYNGAVGNYHSMYDSYQLILNLDESILSGINNIGSNLLEKEIKAAEKEGFSEQQAVKKVLESMLSSVAGEIGSVENSIKTAKEPQKSADEKELKTLKALKGNINSLNTSMTHALNAGGNVSLSSMKGTMGKIGSGLAALKTEDKSFEEGLSLKLTSMEDNLRKHDGSLASAARETAQLKANVERFYKYALPKIESALKRVSSDNSTYGKSISLSTIIKSGVNKGKHEIIDPFTDTSEIIQEIEKQLNGVKNASTTGGMVNLLNKFQMSIGSTLHNLKQSDTGHFKEDYEKAKNAYESAIISKREYLSKVGATSAQYFNYMKNNKVPIGERFSSVSEYGYAIDFLSDYKRTAACVDLTGADYDALSNTAYAKPHKVNAGLIPEWWKTKKNFHRDYERLKAEVIAAGIIAAAAVALAAAQLEIDVPCDLLAAAAIAALAMTRKDEEEAHNSYLGALSIYNNYSHSLPAMQASKNSLWKKRMGTESSKIAQSIEKKITSSTQGTKKAEQRERREASNVEKILKTIASIVSRKKGPAKTQSYL